MCSCIFVPEWGWVGSIRLNEHLPIPEDFRPRVGMGWFLAKGDPVEGTFKFVPEWGWVGSTIAGICALKNKQFSSPLGDELVL